MADSRRHAVKLGPGWLIPAVVVASVAAVIAGICALVTVVAARRVVSPPKRRPEKTRIVSIDAAGECVTLGRNAESVLPGNYSLFFSEGGGHARIGAIVQQSGATVTRRLLGVDFGAISDGNRARISGVFFTSPADLTVPHSEVLIETDLGQAPAWLIPADTPTPRWVIQVHGRAMQRSETLRSVEVFRDAGYTSLLLSYRNDGEAPSSIDGCYGLGDTEWRDVQAAIQFATRRGATEIVLMGWSMGGATVLQTLVRAAESTVVRGVVLDSPVIDWNSALQFQGKLVKLPGLIRSGVLCLLCHRLASRLVGLRNPIDLERLDFVRRSGELGIPILLMHSDDDGFVPIAPSATLAQKRADVVTFERFDGAAHTKLWNYDPIRWNGAIARWLATTQGDATTTGEA